MGSSPQIAPPSLSARYRENSIRSLPRKADDTEKIDRFDERDEIDHRAALKIEIRAEFDSNENFLASD